MASKESMAERAIRGTLRMKGRDRLSRWVLRARGGRDYYDPSRRTWHAKVVINRANLGELVYKFVDGSSLAQNSTSGDLRLTTKADSLHG